MTNAEIVTTNNAEAYSELFDLAYHFVAVKHPGYFWRLFYDKRQWYLGVAPGMKQCHEVTYSCVATSGPEAVEFEAL